MAPVCAARRSHSNDTSAQQELVCATRIHGLDLLNLPKCAVKPLRLHMGRKMYFTAFVWCL